MRWLYVFALSTFGTAVAFGQDDPPPFGPSAAGEFVHDGKDHEFTCRLAGTTLTLTSKGKVYKLTRAGSVQDDGNPLAPPPKKTPLQAPAQVPVPVLNSPLLTAPDRDRIVALRTVILGGDRKGFKALVDGWKAADRVAVRGGYVHKPFVGLFRDETLTLSVGDDHKGTLELGKLRMSCELTPGKHDGKAPHNSAEPFRAGEPVLLDLLTGFGEEGYDLWLNHYLTPDMRDADRIRVQVAETVYWLGQMGPASPRGQKAALRNLLSGLGVRRQSDLNQPPAAFLAFEREYGDSRRDFGTKSSLAAMLATARVLPGD